MMIMENQESAEADQDKYKVVNYDYNSSVSKPKSFHIFKRQNCFFEFLTHHSCLLE
jgi:hypothetical protein